MKTSVKFTGLKRIIVLVVVVLFTAASFAKSACCVAVKVTDGRYQPIDFAKVTLKNADTQKVLKVVLSNENGELKLKKLRPGNYILDVKTPGFATSKVNAFSVREDGAKVMEMMVVLEQDLLEQEILKDNAGAMKANFEENMPDFLL